MDNMEVDTHIACPIGTRVTKTVLTFTIVTGIVVFLRLFTRMVLNKMSGFEDACVVLAMGLSIALTATISAQATHGLGRPTALLTADERLLSLKAFWASLWMYNLALTITKCSVLVQYIRIFPVRRFQKLCCALLAVVIARGAWSVFGNVFLCIPISFVWDRTIHGGHCRDRRLLWYTNAGTNIVLDIVILLLPMPLIWILRIPRSQKRGLVVMIAFGGSASLISIIRLYTLDEVAKSDDPILDNAAHATLSAIEVNVGIICACVPAMRPLFAWILPTYFSTATKHTHLPTKLDIEPPSLLKSIKVVLNTTPSEATQNSAGRNTVQLDLPQSPLSTLSRTPSGRFTVIHSRPNTPGRTISPFRTSHSRTGSNISIEIAAADARANPVRFQGRTNPLRMSPITPPSPEEFTFSPFARESSSKRPCNDSGIIPFGSTWRPQTPVVTKPLPLTPLPISTGR